MKGVIASYRRGRKTQTMNQMIVLPEGASKEASEKLVGKAVVYKTTAGKELTGKITAIHGGKGAVRVLFDTGMPGQAIGAQVSIR